MQKKILFSLVILMLAFVSTAVAQVTTSGINGKVTLDSPKGEEIIGATITAVHTPSGTRYMAVTNATGRYTIQGMRAGGPYEVSVSYVGHETKEFKGITLNLGESYQLNTWLSENAQELGEVVVTGRYGLDASKTGAAQSISAEQINNMPSITHGISDIARLNPQLSVTNAGTMSFAGSNNRYNSFQIDGAMNNDNFGLTTSGANGGQAETQPVSMETIEQIQINVAPFDVRQSGFTGGAINAITKSGTNEFHGSAYIRGYNEKLIGRHYKLNDGSYSDPYQDEKQHQLGFTLGGPIIKNKLFFFANYENTKETYPNLYGLGAEGSRIDAQKATDILADIKEMAAAQGVNYSGNYTNTDVYKKSNKGGLKIDWNINDNNKFSFRWSLVDAKRLRGSGGRSALYTDDHVYEFKSNTNTFIAELQSRFSPVVSNEARVSYVRVRDERTSGNPFPSITVNNVGNSGGTVGIGNEYSSMANSLNQDIWTIEDNLTWYKNDHTITFGTHNEIYTFENLFIQNLYGAYSFGTADNFFNYYNDWKAGTPSGKYFSNYYYYRANVDVTGTPRWAAKFTAGQIGFYAQDKWNITNNFQLTYGLRFDIPLFFDAPVENPGFNEYAESKGWDFQTNRKLSSAPLVSPRVGFRWDINGDRQFILRGGVGVFTGRIPFVWLSNSFSNTGIQMTKYSASRNMDNLTLVLDPNNQDLNGDKLAAAGNQEINVFEKKFSFSQNLRVNLGFDFTLGGINWSAEALYSKTLNDVFYSNLAYDATGKTFGETYGYDWETRPMMGRVTDGTHYANIYVLNNTSKGYSYSLSLKAEKKFDFGLDLMASYAFTKSKSVNSATSSVASSNFTNNHTATNPNEPVLTNSAYNTPHQIKASAFYHVDYGKNKMFRTTVGLIYEGKSGTPYTLYTYGDMNGDGVRNDIFYIPTDAQVDQMKFKASSTYTADEMKANFKQWLANTDYIKDHRGEYYERYADNLPFESRFDLHIAQNIKFATGKWMHNFEISLDIMNVANLLNKDWGRVYSSSSYVSDMYAPLNYSGNGQYQFNNKPDYELFTPNDLYSRWRGQIGLKYTF